MRLIIADSETTGASPRNGDRAVDIGLVEMVGGRRTGRTWQSYFDPKREVHWGALRVHGLSNKFLSGKPRFHEKADEMLAFIDGAPCLAHNARFDREVFLHEFHASGLPVPDLKFHDTIPLAQAVVKASSYSLDKLIAELGLTTPPRVKHGALLDSEILAILLEHLEDLRPGVVTRLSVTSPLTGSLPFLSGATPRAAEASTSSQRTVARPDAVAHSRPKASEVALSPAEEKIGETVREALQQSSDILDFAGRVVEAGISLRPAVMMQSSSFSGFRFTTEEATVAGARIKVPGALFRSGPLAYDHAKHAQPLLRLQAAHDRRFGPIVGLEERFAAKAAAQRLAEDEASPSP